MIAFNQKKLEYTHLGCAWKISSLERYYSVISAFYLSIGQAAVMVVDVFFVSFEGVSSTQQLRGCNPSLCSSQLFSRISTVFTSGEQSYQLLVQP